MSIDPCNNRSYHLSSFPQLSSILLYCFLLTVDFFFGFESPRFLCALMLFTNEFLTPSLFVFLAPPFLLDVFLLLAFLAEAFFGALFFVLLFFEAVFFEAVFVLVFFAEAFFAEDFLAVAFLEAPVFFVAVAMLFFFTYNKDCSQSPPFEENDPKPSDTETVIGLDLFCPPLAVVTIFGHYVCFSRGWSNDINSSFRCFSQQTLNRLGPGVHSEIKRSPVNWQEQRIA